VVEPEPIDACVREHERSGDDRARASAQASRDRALARVPGAADEAGDPSFDRLQATAPEQVVDLTLRQPALELVTSDDPELCLEQGDGGRREHAESFAVTTLRLATRRPPAVDDAAWTRRSRLACGSGRSARTGPPRWCGVVRAGGGAVPGVGRFAAVVRRRAERGRRRARVRRTRQPSPAGIRS
jgi:hypothetical protein